MPDDPAATAARSLVRAVLIAFGAALSLGACSNPLVTLPSDYGERVPLDRLRTVQPLTLDPFEEDETPPPIAGRFEGIESMDVSLEEARAATISNNLDLKVALFNPTIATESLRAEEAKFESVFRPSLAYREDDQPTFDQTASNQQDSISAGAGVDIPLRTGGRVSVDLFENYRETSNPFVTLNTSYATSLVFSYSQPLLRNAGRRANTYTIRIAAYEQQISEARTKLEIIRQIANADRAYWRLYATRQALDVAQQQYELATAQMDRARRLVDAGAVPDVEILRAEQGVAERLEAIIVAENNVLDAQRTLKRVMNVDDLDIGSPVALQPATQPDPMRYALEGRELARFAVSNRMEMLELELQLAADLSTIDFQRNQALPLIALDYRYSIDGLGETFRQSHDEFVDNEFESWSLGLSGQIPIGNEAAEARVRRAILSRLQRLATREARELAIREEVLRAVDNVEAAWQRILAARQAVIAAARTFEAEQRQFDIGARTSTDVLDAATRLAEAQLSEIRALTDYEIALIDLSFATGTTLGAGRIDWDPAPTVSTSFRFGEQTAAEPERVDGAAEGTITPETVGE